MTPEGTSILADIVPLSGSSSPEQLTAWNDNLFFTAVTADKGREMYRYSAVDLTTTQGVQLWKSNGSPAGTAPVKVINSFSGSLPLDFQNVNGKLVFTAITNTSGRELWISDGTNAGTKQLRNIGPGVLGGQITPQAVFENELYFSAFDGLLGRNCFISGINGD